MADHEGVLPPDGDRCARPQVAEIARDSRRGLGAVRGRERRGPGQEGARPGERTGAHQRQHPGEHGAAPFRPVDVYDMRPDPRDGKGDGEGRSINLGLSARG
ncbi:hypothetical protein, partial [Streptosporangium sp. NPDC048865]|uniref:hypothetical protein n=1 Tax=Streptosporangium sp. NPDC048865 TaxID=3155766 RepID=UPI0034198A23